MVHVPSAHRHQHHPVQLSLPLPAQLLGLGLAGGAVIAEDIAHIHTVLPGGLVHPQTEALPVRLVRPVQQHGHPPDLLGAAGQGVLEEHHRQGRRQHQQHPDKDMALILAHQVSSISP